METIMHQIRGSLYKNLLNGEKEEYIAKVISERTLNIAELCKVAVERGGADTTVQAMVHNVNLFLKEMSYQICNGYAVNTGYFQANTLIKGVFNNPSEDFDPEKHKVNIRFKPGRLIKKEIPLISVKINGLAGKMSSITEVTDIKTGSVNHLLTPHRNLRISGTKIKLAGNGNTGILFTHLQTGNVYKLEPRDLISNKPSELIIIIPELNKGTYTLTLKTQFTRGTLLKEPKTINFEKELSVI